MRVKPREGNLTEKSNLQITADTVQMVEPALGRYMMAYATMISKALTASLHSS